MRTARFLLAVVLLVLSVAVGVAAAAVVKSVATLPGTPWGGGTGAGAVAAGDMVVHSITLPAGQTRAIILRSLTADADISVLTSAAVSATDTAAIVQSSATTGTAAECVQVTPAVTDTYYVVISSAVGANYTLTSEMPFNQPLVQFTPDGLCVADRVTPYHVKVTDLTGDMPVSLSGVRISERPIGSSTWRVLQTSTTDYEGIVRLSLSVPKKTSYKIEFLGNQDYFAKTIYATIDPLVNLSNPAAPTTMYRGRSYSVWGYIKPRHSAGSYPVRIYKYRYEGGKWTSYGFVLAKASNYSNYSKYTASVKLPYTGKWRLRAYHDDAEHRLTWSRGYDYVTVK